MSDEIILEEPKQELKVEVKEKVKKSKDVFVERISGIRNGFVLVRYENKIYSISSALIDLTDLRNKKIKINEELLKDVK